MGTPLYTRAILKIRRIAREATPSERAFLRVWPMIDTVEGFLIQGQEKWLFKAARSLPDRANIVEVGSFKGRSTNCLAFGCQGTGKRVYAVDTFNGNEHDFHFRDFLGEFSATLARHGVSDYVVPVVGVSTEVAKTWNKPIHMLFVDGSHRYEDVLADFTGFFPHVVPGGLVAFHDVEESWIEVFRAWHDVIKLQLSHVGYCTSIGYGRKPNMPPKRESAGVRP